MGCAEHIEFTDFFSVIRPPMFPNWHPSKLDSSPPLPQRLGNRMLSSLMSTFQRDDSWSLTKGILWVIKLSTG